MDMKNLMRMGFASALLLSITACSSDNIVDSM